MLQVVRDPIFHFHLGDRYKEKLFKAWKKQSPYHKETEFSLRLPEYRDKVKTTIVENHGQSLGLVMRGGLVLLTPLWKGSVAVRVLSLSAPGSKCS